MKTLLFIIALTLTSLSYGQSSIVNIGGIDIDRSTATNLFVKIVKKTPVKIDLGMFKHAFKVSKVNNNFVTVKITNYRYKNANKTIQYIRSLNPSQTLKFI